MINPLIVVRGPLLVELSFRSLKKGFHGPFLSDPFSIKKKLAGHPEKSEFQPKTEMSRNVAPKPPCYPSRGCFFGIFVCWELFRGNLWPLGLKIVIGGHASRSTFSFGRTANSQTKKRNPKFKMPTAKRTSRSGGDVFSLCSSLFGRKLGNIPPTCGTLKSFAVTLAGLLSGMAPLSSEHCCGTLHFGTPAYRMIATILSDLVQETPGWLLSSYIGYR